MALTTDVTPHIHLTPTQVIQDGTRMKRLRASLCNGTFSYADADAADKIVAECLKICGGSEETLASVLQFRFLFNHTPFHWVLANRPAEALKKPKSKPKFDPDLGHQCDEDGSDAVPPLFLRFLSVCDKAQKDLEQDTQGEIMEVLGHHYHSDVYAAVRYKLTAVPTHDLCNPDTFFCAREDRIVVAAHSRGIGKKVALTFNMPKFFDRLLVDGLVWFEFLAMGILFRLTVQAKRGPSLDHGMPERALSAEFLIKATRLSADANPHSNLRRDIYIQNFVLSSSDAPGGGLSISSDFINIAKRELVFRTDTTIEDLQWHLNPTAAECRDLCGRFNFVW